ncbi:hypothetical protein ACQEU3_45815 [Spirillospora sp. CA-253888]
MPDNTPANNELIIRFHRIGGDVSVATTDFTEPAQALQTIAHALDQQRSPTLTQARYNHEPNDAVIINLANVISIRVSAREEHRNEFWR